MSTYGTYVYRWNASKKKHTYEHRDVMENYLGRPLGKDEVVHHKDGNTKNNHISNLELKKLSDHTSEHLKGSHRGYCSVCGKPQHAKYLCKNHYNQALRVAR